MFVPHLNFKALISICELLASCSTYDFTPSFALVLASWIEVVNFSINFSVSSSGGVGGTVNNTMFYPDENLFYIIPLYFFFVARIIKKSNMGAAVSSNFSEMSQQASSEFSTDISQDTKSAQKAQNSASQSCKNMRIEAVDGASVSACNNKVSQGITAEQINESIQDANIENESYTQMQQKMSQAAKSVVKGFNFGAYAKATNTVKQSMQVSTKMSNEISQECSTENEGINQVLQECDGVDISAKGPNSNVYACNMEVQQEILMKQVAKCQQDAAASNKSVQQLEQMAKQVATAETIGLDPMMLFIIGGIIACVVLIFIGKPIVNSVAKNLLDGPNVAMFAGIAMVVGALVLYVLSWKMKNNPDKWQPQMLATAYPGDSKFIKADRFTDDELANLDEFCSSVTSKSACTSKQGNKGDICAWNYETGTCQIKETFVGYPVQTMGSDTVDDDGKLGGVLPAAVNDACEKNAKCSGWRWDALQSLKNAGGMTIMSKMKSHTVNAGTKLVAGIPFIPKPKNVFDREKCKDKLPTCAKGCNKGLLPDVRPACGVMNKGGQPVLVTNKQDCEGNDRNNNTFTVDQGGKNNKCTIPGCAWRNNQCVNKGGKTDWKCKAYNCLECKKTPMLGIGVTYGLKRRGLPTIEQPKWSKDAYKKYATGLGGESEQSTPGENANMRCGKFGQFGCVKLPAPGVTKAGLSLNTNICYGVAGLGLIMIIVSRVMKKPITHYDGYTGLQIEGAHPSELM